MDRKKYPKNWSEISQRIRFERAKGKCEECGAPHGHYRRSDLPNIFFELLEDAVLSSYNIHEDETPITRIVLTTAHLGIDKPDGTPGSRADTMDCREENLRALCQRCHLTFDRSDNINRRRANRRKSLVEAGQMEMF